VAGISDWTFYFRLFNGSIKAPQLVEFLSHLLQHIHGPVLVIWDGLPVHKSRMVKQFVEQQRGRLEVEHLPAYAPELNPCEYIFGYLKHHKLPNLCPKNLWELSAHSRRELRRMRRRPTLIQAFWNQAGLF